MSTEPLRLAVIGAGRHVRALSLPAIHPTGNMRLVALSTAHAESAARVEAQTGIPTYVGHTALLQRADVEAVLIAAPTVLHATLTVEALRAGKHVYCETPGVSSPEDVQVVAEAHAASGRVLMYGTHLRYAPPNQTLYSLLPDARAGGNVVLSVPCYAWVRHMYDLALYLLGDVLTVTVQHHAGQTITQLQYTSGDQAIIHAGGPANLAIPLEHLELCGSGGIVSVHDGQHVLAYRQTEAVGAHDLTFTCAPATVWAPTTAIPYPGLIGYTLRGYIPALGCFVEAVRTGAPTLSGLEQAERTLRLERAVARAVAEQRAVPIEPAVRSL